MLHIKTSVLNDIDELFETVSISAIEESIENDQNYQYSFLFQKLTDEELKLVQKKESNYLKRFLRYTSEKRNHISIDEKEMKDSDSESRYAFLYSFRVTTILKGFMENLWISAHCNQRMNSRRSKKIKRSKKRRFKKKRRSKNRRLKRKAKRKRRK